MVIIAILAAITTPLFNAYTRKSQVSAAQSQMLKLAGDLERWRAKTLTYKGFTPDGGYETVANTTILLPKGSTAANYKYRITLGDIACRTTSLNPGCTGQGWVMVGQPNTTNSTMNLASRLVLDSNGVRCLTDSVITDVAMASNLSGGGSNAALCIGTSKSW